MATTQGGTGPDLEAIQHGGGGTAQIADIICSQAACRRSATRAEWGSKEEKELARGIRGQGIPGEGHSVSKDTEEPKYDKL